MGFCINHTASFKLLLLSGEVHKTIFFLIITDVFHQYDGVIRGFEVKEGFTNYIKYLTGYETSQYKKQLLEDARQSACVFLPQWQTTSLSSGLTGEDMIMRIAVLNRGLHFCYCRNTYALTEQDLKSLFSEVSIKI